MTNVSNIGNVCILLWQKSVKPLPCNTTFIFPPPPDKKETLQNIMEEDNMLVNLHLSFPKNGSLPYQRIVQFVPHHTKFVVCTYIEFEQG